MAPDHAEDAYPDDDTVVRPTAVPARPERPDLDDTIVVPVRRVGGPADRAAAPIPLPTRREPAPAPAAPAVRLPDGGVVEIEGGTVYVGRRPTLPRVPASGIPRLVSVASPGREVSSTHLAISAVGGAIVVRDMLSTNGTVVKAPGAPARTLLRGESAVVTAGTTLDLGDGNVIVVLR